MQEVCEYPAEHWVELKGDPFYRGRIVIYPVSERFHLDVDIVYKDSPKIFCHIGTFLGNEDERESLWQGIRELENFIYARQTFD